MKSEEKMSELSGDMEAQLDYYKERLNEFENLTESYRTQLVERERQLECAHKRIRDIKKSQRYNIVPAREGGFKILEDRFGAWIMHDDMVKAAALPAKE